MASIRVFGKRATMGSHTAKWISYKGCKFLIRNYLLPKCFKRVVDYILMQREHFGRIHHDMMIFPQRLLHRWSQLLSMVFVIS